MADEHDDLESGELHSPPSDEGEADQPIASDEGSTEAAAAQIGESQGPAERGAPTESYRTLINRHIPGQLVLHYSTRSIQMLVDGDAALRALAVLSGTGHDGYQDRLVPPECSAASGWMTIESTGLLAAEWIPGIDRPVTRITIDPTLD